MLVASYGYPYLQVIPVEGKVMTSGGLGVGYRPKYTFRKPSPQHSKGKGDSSSARHSARLSSTLPLTIDREIDAAAVGQQSSLHGFIQSKHVRMVMLSDYDCISKSVYNFGRYSVKRHKRTLRSHVISYTDRYIWILFITSSNQSCYSPRNRNHNSRFDSTNPSLSRSAEP